MSELNSTPDSTFQVAPASSRGGRSAAELVAAKLLSNLGDEIKERISAEREERYVSLGTDLYDCLDALLDQPTDGSGSVDTSLGEVPKQQGDSPTIQD